MSGSVNVGLSWESLNAGKAPMLEVINLACTRGEHQLFAGISFALNAGELMQVQGANGSGKTTLLRTLCGYIQPMVGEIRWQGGNIRHLDEEYYGDIVYLGHLNAIKNERLSCALAGYQVSDSAAITALRRMGLRGRETFPVKVLSQGQRRRVALARLLISKAALWILDEPLTALDVSAVKLMQEIIAEHLNNRGMVIYTTHQPLQVSGVAARQLMLS